MTILSHKIRLFPTKEQEIALSKAAGTARFAWNWALNEWERQYKEGLKPNKSKLRKQLNSIKKEQFPWMLEVTKCAPEATITNLGIAYSSYFKSLKNKNGRKVGKPKFKSKRNANQSFYIGNQNNQIKNNFFYVPKIKSAIKMAEQLRFSGKIISYTVSKDVDKWYVSVRVDTSIQELSKTGKTVGIDLGIKALAVISNGTVIENQRLLKQNLKKLRRQQRAFARKQKESKNREKARIKLSRIHRKIRLKRRDIIQQATTKLVRNYDVLVIEDLSVANMVKNRKLSLAISEIGWGMFRKILKYKCEIYGKKLIVAGKFYPSSKTCSNCGCIKDSLQLSERTYNCADCGFSIDRDLNAALNLEKLGACCPEVMPVEISVSESLKQEDLANNISNIKTENTVRMLRADR
jgi:putative transposase